MAWRKLDLVLIPSVQGTISNRKAQQAHGFNVRLNPFGTGNNFKPIANVTLFGTLSLNPFGTGNNFKPVCSFIPNEEFGS